MDQNFYTHRINLAVFLLVFLPMVAFGNYTTISDGLWTEPATWSGGSVPSFIGDLPNGSKIYVNHDVHLEGQSFFSGKSTNNLELHVGKDGAAVLLRIDKDFQILNTIKIHVYSSSVLQIGFEPTDPLYDFCKESDDVNYQQAKFSVDGSNQSPMLKIYGQGTFLLYGDFEVNNKFDIIVEPGGVFDVKGGFTAGNTAEVSFEGAGGSIGCDMVFDNGASIVLNVGTLHIGGNLLFGNTATVNMSGSQIDVAGGICSFMGQGQGAVVQLIGNPENPSTITTGYICDNVNIVPVPGIEITDISTLPIDLLAFSASQENEDVILNWSTASEINNAYFTIERSLNMQDWDVAGTVAGAGTTSQVQHYAFTDPFPFMGLSYYRLKQTDFDGRFEYFAPVAVNAGEALKAFTFNLLKQAQTWTIGVQETSECVVEVYSLSGIKLFAGSFSGTISIPAPRQAAVVRVLNDKQQTASRVVM